VVAPAAQRLGGSIDLSTAWDPCLSRRTMQCEPWRVRSWTNSSSLGILMVTSEEDKSVGGGLEAGEGVGELTWRDGHEKRGASHDY
jgi:hypothetical protein